MTTHCSCAIDASRSSPMLRSAMLTTVPSSIAIPEPRTAAASTHRPCGVPARANGCPCPARPSGRQSAVRLRDQPGVAHLRRVRRPRRRAAVPARPASRGTRRAARARWFSSRHHSDAIVVPRRSIACSDGLDRGRGEPGAPLVGVHREVPQRAVVVRREQVEAGPSSARRDQHVDPGLVEHQSPARQDVVVGERVPLGREDVAQAARLASRSRSRSAVRSSTVASRNMTSHVDIRHRPTTGRRGATV